jgi:hypothetical protein
MKVVIIKFRTCDEDVDRLFDLHAKWDDERNGRPKRRKQGCCQQLQTLLKSHV